MGSEGFLGTIAQWIQTIMDLLGAPGLGLVLFAETIFPFFPSELILPFAGFTAAQPHSSFGFLDALIWSTLGAVGGATVLYWIGFWFGHDRTVRLFRRIPLVEEHDVKKAIAWFLKYEGYTVFFGRMLPVFRSLVSIPAGIERMNIWRFLILTTAGSFIWNAAFIWGGYVLGDQWEKILEYSGVLDKLIPALLLLLILLYIAIKVRKRRRIKHAKNLVDESTHTSSDASSEKDS